MGDGCCVGAVVDDGPGVSVEVGCGSAAVGADVVGGGGKDNVGGIVGVAVNGKRQALNAKKANRVTHVLISFIGHIPIITIRKKIVSWNLTVQPICSTLLPDCDTGATH